MQIDFLLLWLGVAVVLIVCLAFLSIFLRTKRNILKTLSETSEDNTFKTKFKLFNEKWYWYFGDPDNAGSEKDEFFYFIISLFWPVSISIFIIYCIYLIIVKLFSSIIYRIL